MNAELRPLCVQCKTNPRAMGYRKGTKIYWRRHCDACLRKKKNLKIGGITPLNVLDIAKNPSANCVDLKHVSKFS